MGAMVLLEQLDTEAKKQFNAEEKHRIRTARIWRVEEFEGEDRAAAVHEFCKTMRKERFCRILLPEHLEPQIDAVHHGADVFFDLDDETKEAVGTFTQVQKKLTGYSDGRLREQFECRLTHTCHMGDNPPVEGDDLKPIPYPLQPEEFAPALTECYRTFEGYGHFYLSILSEGMGIEPSFWQDLCDEKEGAHPMEHYPKLPTPESTTSSILRVMKYDSQTAGEMGDGGKELLCEAHLDVGFVTIDPCTATPGLEAEDCDGNWREVEAERTRPTEAILLVGETLSKISNGYYTATNHRVRRPEPGVHRIAMPFLLRGRPTAVINTKNAKRIKAKRPGALCKFKTITIKQLPNVDAGRALVRMVLKDQLAQYKAKKASAGQEAEASTAQVLEGAAEEAEAAAKAGEDSVGAGEGEAVVPIAFRSVEEGGLGLVR